MVDKKSINITLGIIVFTLLILIFFSASTKTLTQLAVYVFMLLTCVIFWFTNNPIKDKLYNYKLGSSLIFSLIGAGIFGAIYYFVFQIIPGLSIGLPTVPQSIGSSVKFVIICFFAPIVETLFFQGLVYGALIYYTKSPIISTILHGVFFSLSHLGAYIFQFYEYPTFAQGFLGFSANITLFISAFVFAVIGMTITRLKIIQNLTFMTIFHVIINLIVYTATFSIIA